MEGKCQWCDEVCELYRFDVMGVEYQICNKCRKAIENDKCIKCGQSLSGEVTINGMCSGCQQIKSAKIERGRSEVMDGLGVEILAELTHSIVFTEKDYERWLTFSQGNFTPEVRKRNRRLWVKNKLIGEYNWSEDTFDKYVNDIEYLLDNYMHKMFNKSCTIVVKGTTGVTRGLNIVASKGDVMIIDNE